MSQHLSQVRQLKEEGLFRDALALLDRSRSEADDRLATQVLKAELLERLGRADDSQALMKRAMASRGLGSRDRGVCELTLARIAIDAGRNESGIAHLNKAISYSQQAGDLDTTCMAQLKLLLVLSDGPKRDATGPLLASVRANAVRTGNARSLAAVHVYFAQIEGYRSSVNGARRHIRLARQLLTDAPCAWLESIASNIEMSLCLMGSHFEHAKSLGLRGRELAERSGVSTEMAVNQGNLGYAYQALGELDDAVACYEAALNLLMPGGEAFKGIVDSLARVKLAQNRLDECETLLDQIASPDLSNVERWTFVTRHVQLTRAKLLLRKGNYPRALELVEQVLKMCRAAGDHLMTTLALIDQGELLSCGGRLHDVLRTVDEVAQTLNGQPAFVYGRYQELLNKASELSDHPNSQNLERAERVYKGLHHNEALAGLVVNSCQLQVSVSAISIARRVLQSAAAVMSHYRHTEYCALELFDTLVAIESFAGLEMTSHGDNGRRTLATHGEFDAANCSHRLLLGGTKSHRIEIAVVLKPDVESLATFHAVSMLLENARALDVAAEEAAERTTLWPPDDLPPGSTHVISGHMRELMLYAQRVARTNVSVLITGESGTGKEIIARAIHDFSDRAQRPFVPFNCAAVPRDLLESQLFGHRRGAFTGADHDQLGLVRGAGEGTIFLDEVAEMSVDLQPKLLRFLESGEIAPLGEPSPFNVNIRVIAATNANLEDAVRDGKFREDLFYRLNVVRLSIKPLRERRDEIPGMVNQFVALAAREYKKGHLQVSEDTMERLLLYRWPGNVRQLQNEIRRIVASAEPNSTLEPHMIAASILGAMPDLRSTGLNGREIAVPLHQKLAPTLSHIEYEMIKAALREHQGRLEPAAKSLGISRKGLYLKRQRLGL